MIDPKELHIGAHVEYEGERYAVTIIATFVNLTACVTLKNIRRTEPSVDYDKIQPIPITPELLTELRFKKMEEFGDVSVWQKNNLIVKVIGKRKVISFVDKIHSMEVQYLHQLENFVYQITKYELIK